MSESVSVTRSPSVSLIVTKTDDFSLAKNFRLKFHILGQTMISSHVQSTRHLKHQDKNVDIQQRSVVSRTSDLKIIVEHVFFSSSFQREVDCVF